MAHVLSTVETLENRRLLYGSFIENNALLVDGDAGADTIRVYSVAGSTVMTVEVSTQPTLQFPLSGFNLVVISGFDGNDLISAEDNGVATGKQWELYGGPGNDTISGTEGADFIRGQAGNDLIQGNGGDDHIYGDDGADSIYGGAGNDVIFGNFGGDYISGGLGDDSLMGGIGLDTVEGDDGNDTIFGGNGMDVLRGGAGNDYTEGKGKADAIYGGAGNDTILAGAGSDLVFGEDGDDWLYANSSPFFSVTLNGGAGYDRYESGPTDFVSECEEKLLV